MADFSKIKDTTRIPATIPTDPYLLDHAFDQKAVLPAVEALEIIADAVLGWRPGSNVMNMQAVAFDKFLHLNPAGTYPRAYVEISACAGGNLTADLATKIQTGRTPIIRTRSHARLTFPDRPAAAVPAPLGDAANFEGEAMSIDPDRIYRELVPFGPSYQNISAPVRVSEQGAIARVRAPEIEDINTDERILGSPFVLDAAFHAACVWGQRFAGIVAFPVSLDQRTIHQQPQQGAVFICRIKPVKTDAQLLIFDIWIYSEAGEVIEEIGGLHMRDVSGGRIKPPEWIQKGIG